MAAKKTALMLQVEKVFADIGGYTWEQAEIWAGFCQAVGMDPLPFLKVMVGKLCAVKTASAESSIPSRAKSPELWVVLKGSRTRFKLVEP